MNLVTGVYRMAKRKHERQERKLNLDTFRRGIRGKVLEAVSIANELNPGTSP